jgi:mRNA-degrading endonuclease toxin of MazEF toxin-antitoxin module
MSRPEQGEVWWADLPKPAGRRPVVVLTRSDVMHRGFGMPF